MFLLEQNMFSLKYREDTELIQINSEEDWQNALKTVNNKDSPILRIVLIEVNENM